MTRRALNTRSARIPRAVPFGRVAAVTLALLVIGSGVAPGQAQAQSVFNSGGLGLQTDPMDARARGVGGVGVGLSGWQMLMTDPAAAAGLRLPSISGTFQPSVTQVSGAPEAGGTRFPLVGTSYPFGRHVFTAQFGSLLDQEWAVTAERLVDLAAGPTPALDRYESQGGIGQARLGWATRIGEQLAVGVGVGSLVGSVERRFTRELESGAVEGGLENFRQVGEWRVSGATAIAGVNWFPSDLLHVGASLEWVGDMTLAPVRGTEGVDRSYSMPLTLRTGGTFTLAPDVRLVMGVSRADWSGVDGDLGGDAARDVVWGYGGGVEWARGTVRGRAFPLRMGYRVQELPFHVRGEAAEEKALSAGFGINLADAQDLPLARLDLSVERGSRDAGALSEEYWRTTVSLRLAGG